MPSICPLFACRGNIIGQYAIGFNPIDFSPNGFSHIDFSLKGSVQLVSALSVSVLMVSFSGTSFLNPNITWDAITFKLHPAELKTIETNFKKTTEELKMSTRDLNERQQRNLFCVFNCGFKICGFFFLNFFFGIFASLSGRVNSYSNPRLRTAL